MLTNHSSTPETRRYAFDCVEVRRLTSEERALYPPPSPFDDLIEILGEWQEKGEKLYFARGGDGEVHRYSAQGLETRRYDLVTEYGSKRLSNVLKLFDPTSDQVHPDSRVKSLRITLKKRDPSARATSSEHDVQSASSSEPVDSQDGESENASDKDEDTDGTPPTRTSTRLASKSTKNLPFSPRKTRASRHFVTHGEEDAATPSDEERPRRITSSRAPQDSDDEAEVVPSSSDESVVYVSRGKGKGKGKGKGRAPPPILVPVPPVLNRVCSVDDLEEDADPETTSLRTHRSACEKCGQGPVHLALKKKGRRRKLEEFEEEDDILGGWLRCVKCPIVFHWGCVSSTKQNELVRNIRQEELGAWRAQRSDEALRGSSAPSKRDSLSEQESVGFLCAWCTKSEVCMGCHEKTANMGSPSDQLLFRCNVCTRTAHYAHLPQPDEDNPVEIGTLASYYQETTGWKCHDCSSFVYPLDKIIAWRPYPRDAKDPAPPDYAFSLPREYLVKWQDRSYKRVQWVPHMWLLATNRQKLRKFVLDGRTIKLRDRVSEKTESKESAQQAMLMDVDREELMVEDDMLSLTKMATLFAPVVDAEERIPPGWRTVDRVLDVLLFKRPVKKLKIKLGKRKASRVDSDEEMEPEARAEFDDAFEHGEEPAAEYTETIAEWERRNKRSITLGEVGDIVWAFIKWGDLGYEDATWDAPPRPGDANYDAFERAFTRFVRNRAIPQPKGLTGPAKGSRPKNHFFRQHALDKNDVLDLGQELQFKLMDFQVDGFNWLCNNWWNRQPCILADEMGLGKTVQISTFLGKIIQEWNAYPVLVVVPNSTITNWVRELERWAPKLKVVPFFGDARARKCIIEYELTTFHVIVASYEAFTTGPDFNRVFKKQPRWEVLIVDEGQRLKNNESLTFKKLNELNIMHRVIMTGTPLNNNIRELFNLMNFLDPENWADLEALEEEYSDLTEEHLKQLHERLRPYFLRRTKKEVLKLPPKNEVIVPVSMSTLQKQVTKSIYSGNFDLLRKLGKESRASSGMATLKNMLMQLRKCLQHPYLVSAELEPTGLSDRETHEKLVEASTKLNFLRLLLPQLKARGHRVLLFSQFVIALDIIEDYLKGEGVKFLRLDGSTQQRARQEGIDEFNREGSDVFLYMLTTRAGGAGINLWSADTVIIFDPDFNPHQDLQAIARAHRFGQKKTVLVFTLMVKKSVEERIMQKGKQKLVLDHLIVQKMDDDEPGGNDVQSMLTYGAQALFDEEEEGGDKRDINYTEADIKNLIERTEQATEEEDEEGKGGGFNFSFAKVWEAAKDDLIELPTEGGQSAETNDSWAATLAKLDEERLKAKAAELTGRGARRRNAQHVGTYGFDEGDARRKARAKGDSDFSASGDESASGTSSEGAREDDPAFKPRAGADWTPCGLCAQMHRPGDACSMMERSEHLAEYRFTLLTRSEHEPYEKRLVAIQAIEETLFRRGDIAMIQGQPLHLLPTDLPAPTPVPASKPKARKSATAKAAAAADPAPADSTFAGLSGPKTNGTAEPKMNGTADGANPAKSKMKKKVVAAAKPEAYENAQACAVCSAEPFHVPNKCPVVKQGAASISGAIMQLDDASAHTALISQTRSDLRKILKRVKAAAAAREAEAAAAAEVPASGSSPPTKSPEPMQVDG